MPERPWPDRSQLPRQLASRYLAHTAASYSIAARGSRLGREHLERVRSGEEILERRVRCLKREPANRDSVSTSGRATAGTWRP